MRGLLTKQRALAAMLALVSLLTACGDRQQEAPPAPWELVESSPESSLIVIEIGIGVCDTIRQVKVTEQDEAVYVQVLRTEKTGDCTLQMLLFREEIALSSPLGTRPVINGRPASSN